MFYQIPLFLNLGTPELIVIMFVVLLLFGGKKLPELARGLGKGLRDFKDASEGLKTEINNQINQIEEVKKEATSKIEEIAKDATAEVTDKSAVTEPQPYNEPEFHEAAHYNEGGEYIGPDYHQETTLMPESPAPETMSSEPVIAKAKPSKKKLKTEKS